jgi:hypothetical protein
MIDLNRLRRLSGVTRPPSAGPATAPEVAPAPEPVAPAPEPVAVAVAPAPEPEPEPVAVAPEPAWSMDNTKAELVAAAEAADIEVQSGWTKSQILEALTT